MSKITAADPSWTYVGRFMYGFGLLETDINIVFQKMFDLTGLAALMLEANVDLRKKIDLIMLGLKHQGLDQYSKTLAGVHELANIRNVVAHSLFDEEPALKGIVFHGYTQKSGEKRLPHKPSCPDKFDENLLVTYAEFDAYNDKVEILSSELRSLEEIIKPINELTSLRAEVAEIISSPSNIVLFPKRPVIAEDDRDVVR